MSFPVLLVLLALARAEVPEADPASEEVAQVDVATALQEARQLYFQGEHQQALAAFQRILERLQGGEVAAPEVEAQVAMYLGEVQYQLGDRTAAWRTFEWLLRRQPDLEMSPLRHPREVIGWFDLVRQRVRQELDRPPDPVPPPPPLPVWGYLPLGIPQLAQGQTSRGMVYGGLQLGLAGLSIGTWFRLARINGPNHPPGLDDDEVAALVQRERFLIQWPATVGAYAFYAVSVLDGRRTWFRRHELEVALLPAPDRPGILLVGRFR